MKKYSIHNISQFNTQFSPYSNPCRKAKIEKIYIFNAQTVKTPKNQPTVIHTITPNTHNL